MLQRPHFLPNDKPKLGGADGALREDHLVYGQIARGQPYDAKCLQKASIKASVLLPLAPVFRKRIVARFSASWSRAELNN